MWVFYSFGGKLAKTLENFKTEFVAHFGCQNILVAFDLFGIAARCGQ